MSVLAVISYILSRTHYYEEIISNKLNIRKKITLLVMFGLLSVYGTIFGIRIGDTTANLRDLGPVIAGFMAGPWVGLGSGLIGGIHRWTLGGTTQISCSIVTVMAGLIAGLIYKYRNGKLISMKFAVVFMFSYELFHMLMVILIACFKGNLPQSIEIVKQALLPMTIANSLGIALIIYFTQNMVNEISVRSEKNRIDSELKIARTIQESLLPRVFPPFPDRKEFELTAINIPAKEVAGDFFDFFFTKKDCLVLVIADVSGKGVSAGLFMAVTRTLLKTICQEDITPSQAMSKANRIISIDNDSCMFTTLFLAFYESASGCLTYANAGHNPPYIVSPNGNIRKLNSLGNMALGIDETHQYKQGSDLLEIGDILTLYTDGVTEATSPQNQLYGEKRFEEILKAGRKEKLEYLQTQIENDLLEFQDFNRFDDITYLMLRRKI